MLLHNSKLSSILSAQIIDKPYGGGYSATCGGDVIASHAVAFASHVTLLILLKGSLDSLGTRLFPDKAHLSYALACDGPGRGGTCDISAWDSFYLAFFWLLNCNSWLTFGVHWKTLLLQASSYFKAPAIGAIKPILIFEESSQSLNGWFKDYLWFNSSCLIRGYDAVGANDISVFAWTFLLSHLCWATGFMFLISWRGYWQEILDIIIFLHMRTPLLYDIWNASLKTPGALSIVQARFIGLVHFASGYILTYAAFILGSSR